VDSCTDCYAWGATRTHKWRCKGCEHWHGHHAVGTCPVCRRTVPLNAEEGVCRLCLRQRAYIRQCLGLEADLVEATREGHQPISSTETAPDADSNASQLSRLRRQSRPSVTGNWSFSSCPAICTPGYATASRHRPIPAWTRR